MKELRSIAQLTPKVLSHLTDCPVESSIQRRLNTVWRHHIGEVAMHSFPVLFQSGKLVVFCESPVWGTQLRHQVPSLKKQLSVENFYITDVQIKMHLATGKPVGRLRKPSFPPFPESVAKPLQTAIDSIEHAGLRQALRRLVKSRIDLFTER